MPFTFRAFLQGMAEAAPQVVGLIEADRRMKMEERQVVVGEKGQQLAAERYKNVELPESQSRVAFQDIQTANLKQIGDIEYELKKLSLEYNKAIQKESIGQFRNQARLTETQANVAEATAPNVVRSSQYEADTSQANASIANTNASLLAKYGDAKFKAELNSLYASTKSALASADNAYVQGRLAKAKYGVELLGLAANGLDEANLNVFATMAFGDTTEAKQFITGATNTTSDFRMYASGMLDRAIQFENELDKFTMTQMASLDPKMSKGKKEDYFKGLVNAKAGVLYDYAKTIDIYTGLGLRDKFLLTHPEFKAAEEAATQKQPAGGGGFTLPSAAPITNPVSPQYGTGGTTLQDVGRGIGTGLRKFGTSATYEGYTAP